MEVVKNEWKVDCQHIVNSIAKRCKIIGRSTSRTAYGFRVFQGFREGNLTDIIAKFNNIVDDCIMRNNHHNAPVVVTEQVVDNNTVFKYFKINNQSIIKFEFRQSDKDLVYVNCQYSPRDPNLIQRRQWTSEMINQPCKFEK